MPTWEADLYRRPLCDDQGNPLWELLVCDRAFAFTYGATIAQSAVNSAWVAAELQTAIAKAGESPEHIEVFRPQALALLQSAGAKLNIAVKPSRHVPTLKQWLVTRSRWYPTQANFTQETYDPLAIDRPAPVPMPEALWGEQWRFGALSAEGLQGGLIHEPIPIQSVPEAWLPLQLGIASPTPIPGVIIDAGRKAMPLAQWIQAQNPVALNYIPGAPDGLILEAGLCDRWVLTTFTDAEVQTAAHTFAERQRLSQGLHFLLIRPDDSGITYTGLWLLRSPTL